MTQYDRPDESALFACWAPGLPHVLHPEKSEPWALLQRGYQQLAAELAAFAPETLVIYSTQWLSVLGTSFQAHPHPTGTHVDENWYELGDLPFDFHSDARLSDQFAAAYREAGFPAKTICYDEFPIDTGTITALRFLNPDGKIPVSVVSSCVYSDAAASRRLGEVMRQTAARAGKRVAFLACSSLSTRYFTDDIDPRRDAVSSPSDDAWNRRILGLLESGELAKVSEVSAEYARAAAVDMRFNAFHWLHGVLGNEAPAGRVLAYGPQVGTGAAVIAFKG